MTREHLGVLRDARDKLCRACSAVECETCYVPRLIEKCEKEVNSAVKCSYCDPSSQDYNPCWLCKKGGTAHDVEHCHKTNYGDYEPMQPHCHLCGRKL